MIFPVIDLTALIAAHLQAPIATRVAEGREGDDQSRPPGGRDQGKVGFLPDLVSYANTAGGHLSDGMDEGGLLPTALPGIVGVDWDGLRASQTQWQGGS